MGCFLYYSTQAAASAKAAAIYVWCIADLIVDVEGKRNLKSHSLSLPNNELWSVGQQQNGMNKRKIYYIFVESSVMWKSVEMKRKIKRQKMRRNTFSLETAKVYPSPSTNQRNIENNLKNFFSDFPFLSMPNSASTWFLSFSCSFNTNRKCFSSWNRWWWYI